jgi:hypothetical protein
MLAPSEPHATEKGIAWNVRLEGLPREIDPLCLRPSPPFLHPETMALYDDAYRLACAMLDAGRDLMSVIEITSVYFGQTGHEAALEAIEERETSCLD